MSLINGMDEHFVHSFGSDNHSGVCNEAFNAIVEANRGHVHAYGDDPYTAKAVALFKKEFGADARVLFVFNGTGANVLCLDAMCRSHHAVICAETAHINVDECGAPQRIVGCKLLTVRTVDGKLTPQGVREHLHGFGFEHHSQPRAISITEPTELGTLYTIDEIKALANLAHDYGMFLHIDGARLANAAAALGCGLADLTTKAGVDCVSFGGTKNGLMMAESAVLLNASLDVDMPYRRKQMSQLCSKMRYAAAQFVAYLDHELWRRNANHSNKMAQRLKASVEGIEGVRVMYEVQANSVFVQMKREIWQALQQEYFFYDWDEANDVVRWMCSWDTTEDDIDAFVQRLKVLCAQ